MTALALPLAEDLSATPAASTPPTPTWDDPLAWDAFTRWHVSADGQRLGVSALQISGMHCAACAGTVEQALAAVPGVTAVQASAAAQRASFTWDPARSQPSAWLAALRHAGYGAWPDRAASHRDARMAEQRAALWRWFVAALCSMQVMMLAAPSYVAGPPELSLELAQVLNWGGWVLSLPVLLFAARPLFAAAWASLRRRRMAMEVPAVLGIVVTFVASTAATFDPRGPLGHQVYFDSLTMFVAFLLGARWLEMKLRHRAEESLEDSSGQLPQTAWRVLADGAVQAVHVGRLCVGDRVLVPLGEAFAADGVLVQGQTVVDEAMLSGESRPVAKQANAAHGPGTAGSSVWAGTINRGAPVQMLVRHLGADTRMAAIHHLVRQALTQRPASARLADRWATPFTVAVLLLAVTAGVVWWQFDPSRALPVAVAVLIVTCPCALSLAVPSAQLAATLGLARRGVIVQRLRGLELLATVDHVFFDKTGTLTDTQTAVPLAAASAQMTSLQPHAPGTLLPEPDLWAHACGLAEQSSHPVSQAVAAAAQAQHVQPAGFAGVQETPGVGMQGIDSRGRTWSLGAWSGLAERGTADTAYRVWLVCDGVALAGFDLPESVRADAGATIAALQKAGLHVSVLSGDEASRTDALARLVGADRSLAGASPDGKLSHIQQAQAAGAVVLMVGDGVNDSPVLAGADVSMAMAHGARGSREQADFLLSTPRLAVVAEALGVARRTRGVARQNLLWAAAYNLLSIPLAVAGWLPPWAAGLGMASSSLLVMLNAARLSR